MKSEIVPGQLVKHETLGQATVVSTLEANAQAVLLQMNDGYRYMTRADMLTPVKSLPDAQFIAWVAFDRSEQVAIRSGHPANRVWIWNSIQHSEDYMLELIGTAPVVALEVVGGQP